MKIQLVSFISLIAILSGLLPITPIYTASPSHANHGLDMDAPPLTEGWSVPHGILTATASHASSHDNAARVPYADESLSLAFIPNQGQVDERVSYYTQAGDHSLWFTAAGVTLALPATTLRLAFVDANPEPQVTGGARQSGIVNYFIGNNPARWRTGIPTYGAVTYRALWPGVDVSYQAHTGALKSTFTVMPGAAPAQIRLAYPEAERLSVDAAGALVIHVGVTEIRESAPVAWQTRAGRQSPVAVTYQVLADGHTYGFALPQGYDPAYPLVIDPELRYSTFLGGSAGDSGSGIAVDAAGAIYVTGSTSSADFPSTPGAFDTGHNGSADAFVIKLDAGGAALAYATFVGGSSSDTASAIVIDAEGHAYVAGTTYSTDFPIPAPGFDTSFNGGSSDVFVIKLNAAGDGLDYVTFLGGSNVDWHGGGNSGGDIAVDAGGNLYVTGYTRSADFPTTPGAFDTSHGGGTCSGGVPCGDAFVVKLNAAGTELAYATFLGGNGGDEGYALAVDETSAAYITGAAGANTFPTTTLAFDTSFNGGGDAFVVKLAPNGATLDYATFLGGSSTDYGYSIVVDGAGHAYVTGITYSPAFPTTPGAFDTGHNGGVDAFVTRLNAAGSDLDYATFLGGNGDDYSNAIAVDETGAAYVTGFTQSTNFPTTPAALDASHNGGSDAFVAVFNAAGDALDYATYLGGGSNEGGGGIVVDGIGSVYVAGGTSSAEFPVTAAAYDPTHNGGSDIFVSHLTLLAYLLAQGDQALETGRAYRANFHAELGGPASVTISETLAHYTASGLAYLNSAEQYYAAALRWADPGTITRTNVLAGLLNVRWEMATGAMLSGNEFMVQALDVKFENPSDPLLEEIGQLQEASAWYTLATDGYAELLISEHYTDLLALQPARVHPISGQPAPYLDLQRLALAAAQKSRATLELAERQFRRFTPTSLADAETTLRRGAAQALANLTLLETLWGAAADDANYQELLRTLSDMQRLFRYLQTDKNLFGYGREYVPFHFQPAALPQNNFEQTLTLAQTEWAVARDMVDEAAGRQQESDDNYVILQQRLVDVVARYDAQLIQLCGANPTDPTQPDFAGCHANNSGEIYQQILRIQEANLRIQLVEQQMANQLELIRIEEERAARVAGIHRATAEMYTTTGEKLADLASEEVKLRERKTWTEKITGVVTGIIEGAVQGAAFGPYGAIAGGVVGGLAATAQLFEEDAKASQLGDLAAKRERLQAQQSAYVQYAEAEIVDVNSEALIKQYMLRFTEYDIELSIALNNLQQELARLNGLKTQVEYLAAEKQNALAFTAALYQDPAGRVLRDYYMELASDRFDVALRYAWQAGRALEYEINQDAAFMGGPLTDLSSLYRVRDITTLEAALAQMNTAYHDFLARPDVPTPQQRQDILYLSAALGFADAYDADLGRVVTRAEKFNAFIRDPAHRDARGNLQFTFQTSIALGNPFFSTGVFNDKIVSIQARLRGNALGNDRAILYLRQGGTSFIRTLNAFQSSGPDDVRAYNVEPLKASVTAVTNDSTLPPAVAINQELATRSVAFTNWTVTLDQVNEPENQDVDVAGITEIELTLTHEAYTLQNRRAALLHRTGAAPCLRRPTAFTATDRVQEYTAAAPLSGIYIGTVVLTNPVGLTPLDLNLVLTDTGGGLSGYINAAQVLGYPVVAGDHGPSITGAWSGVGFALQSGIFTDPTITATRQVMLHTGIVSDDGETLTGVYRETLWGLTPEPLVVVGRFSLTRPAHIPPAGQPIALQLSAIPARLHPGESALLIARLSDFYSSPISQTQVSFATTAGTVTPPTATTNITGEAFVTFVAGVAPGSTTITATAAGLTGTTRLYVLAHVYLPLVWRAYPN